MRANFFSSHSSLAEESERKEKKKLLSFILERQKNRKASCRAQIDFAHFYIFVTCQIFHRKCKDRGLLKANCLLSFSSMTTMLQTSNIVWQSVSLTDEVKINLEYDIHRGLLNIFVKNIGDNNKSPCHINVLSNSKSTLLTSSEIQQGLCIIIILNFNFYIRFN